MQSQAEGHINARYDIETAEYDFPFFDRHVLNCDKDTDNSQFEASPLKAEMADTGHHFDFL
ncbi:hypothetical protein ASE00_10210 [Sphingomonas sp. Root710]|nr:hypothetical protein ASE00_10210 [Sphingomonas sp. Root710]